MNELRWILLGIGIVVIAAIWFVSRRKHATRDNSPPELTDEVDVGIDPDELDEIGRELGGVAKGREDRMIVSLHVAADHPLDGLDLFASLDAAGLEYGRMDIYHYVEDGRELFSVANMLEPGTFTTEETTGITLFAVLDGEVSGMEVFDRMLSCAMGLASKLDAEVLTGEREPLDPEAEAALRREITMFEARLLARLSLGD